MSLSGSLALGLLRRAKPGNGFGDGAASAFRRTDVISNLKEKGFLFDPDAPFDRFDMRG